MRALLVTSGAYGGTLAAARALRAAGWEVGVGSPGRLDFARSSRAVARGHVVPNAVVDYDGFLAAVARAVETFDYEVVFPGGDTEVLTLSRERGRIPCTVPYANHETVVTALDKLRLHQMAEGAGLAVPEMGPATPDRIAAVSSETVVVKSRLHFFPGRDRMTRYRATAVCHGVDEVRQRVEAVRSDGAEPVIEQWLPGDLIALVVVTNRRGDIEAALQQRAERTWPRGAGITARGVVVPVDDALRAGAQRLMHDLGWFGLAELQFTEPGDGVPRLIDLNGRFYGSLALAVGAGANLPALWAALATGRHVPAPVAARVGTRYQWFEADLKRSLLDGRAGWRDLPGALRYAATSAHGVWSGRDPLPAVVYSAQLAGRAARRLWERGTR